MSNEIASYKRAIDILTSNNYDPAKMVVELAKENPALFIVINEKLEKAEEASSNEVVNQMNEQLLSLIRAGKKVEAIKHYRAFSGVGLKEAKDYVDGLDSSHYAPTGTGTW